MGDFNQLVHKILTGKAGKTVHRQELCERLDLRPEQVAGAVARLQEYSDPLNEIETVQRGNVWRFVPCDAATQLIEQNGSRRLRRVDLQRNQPLTRQLEQYFTAAAGLVVYRDDLVRYTGKTYKQVCTGINNMLVSNGDMREHLQRLIQGQTWRYLPPVKKSRSRRPQIVIEKERIDVDASKASTADVVPSSVVHPASSPKITVSSNGHGGLRTFTEVQQGKDGTIIVVDNSSTLWRVVPL